MDDRLPRFERIVRRAGQFTVARSEPTGGFHPFDDRNVHPKIRALVKQLFDDGHFPEATFKAYKFVDKEVQRHSKASESGFKLMMKAFAFESPLIQLTPMQSESEKDEQRGFQFLFTGS